MVDHLPVMVAAVIIAMGVMLLASKPLTDSVNVHPTVVVLCLSFLLMIGRSLLAEGLGFHMPKGYLYAAIWLLDHDRVLQPMGPAQPCAATRPHSLARAHRQLHLAHAGWPLRASASANGDHGHHAQAKRPRRPLASKSATWSAACSSLAERSVQSVMTPRSDIEWIDLEQDSAALREQLLQARHGLFPVASGELDKLSGVARARDLLADVLATGSIDLSRSLRQPLVVPTSVNVIKLVEQMRHSRAQIALVSDEFGSILGLVTPIDLLEAIAGEFPEEGELPDIQPQATPGHWVVDGQVDLHALETATEIYTLAHNEDYSTLAGFLLDHLEQLPAVGQVVEAEGLRFEVLEMDKRRIAMVDVRGELHSLIALYFTPYF